MKPVRWGLLSTARINRRLIPAIRASKRGRLVSVASRDAARVREYAAEWKIETTFDSYEAMLESDAVDAVYISLPNHLHAEWTVKALRAGKHVLCEKPFALTVAEVDQMAAASRETGRVLQEAFMYRHHPQTLLVEEWVRSGRLGDITLLRGLFSFPMAGNPQNIRLRPEAGGGALWDVGVYPLSYAQFLYGSAPQVVFGVQHIGPTGVDQTFSGQLQYAGQRAAQIACGFELPFSNFFEINGTLGRITLNHPFTGMTERDRQILFTPAEGKPEKLKVKTIDPYLLQVEDMHAAILDGKAPRVTLAESREHIRTAVALYESAASGQTVRLE